MSKLLDSLRTALGDLQAVGARVAVVGGLAVSVRTEPRTTRDADFAVSVTDDAEAESLVGSLRRSGYEVAAGIEQVETGRLASVRLWPPGDRRRVAIVDLLFASSGIEPEIVDAAEPLEILEGVVAPVATTGHLIALKLLARDDLSRPQDRADLVALLRVATAHDRETAREAAAVIAARGFARGRDLARALDDLLRELSAPP